ncbi:sugar ABC transporter ATP-binding protein [Arthrobacter sp. NPDC056691]|uniref:sugar ABC transporter ATP-binding protein n=1 Tax=Arthrobacter sp. NPDC056691 TaxID=3345913 RepID=UPI0036712DA8
MDTPTVHTQGPGTDPAAEALRVVGLNKSYGASRVLKDVSLTVGAGEIHALVGENGAGKSTLIKAVAGAIDTDAGSIAVWGRDVTGAGPAHVSKAGLAVIYQELTIVPGMSALANVLLGSLPAKLGFVDGRNARRQYDAAAEAVGVSIKARTPAGTLSTAQQQMLEIMRALASQRRLIIMDEPTASLGPSDSAHLHTVMRDLSSRGYAIIYISHDLDHVLALADTVTVLREGAVIDSRPGTTWTKPQLIRAMLGNDVTPAQQRPAVLRQGPPVLSVRSLRAPGVDLPAVDIHAGEIVGLAGLVGSGRTRLLRSLAGAAAVTEGELSIKGQPVPWPGSPRSAIRAGIALAPEDRKGQGLVLNRSAGWNVALGQFRKAAGGKPLQDARASAWASSASSRMGFDPRRLASHAGELSGGNQQKLLLARWLDRNLTCLLLDEPTRGIDIGAKAQIFETVRALADEGLSVLWCSSDLEEVVQHSDRMIVLSAGRAIAELPGGASVQDILDLSYAATRERTPGGENPTKIHPSLTEAATTS